MLHVNDVILEVNGIPVDKPEVLQDIIRKNSSNLIQFRIIPSFNEQIAQLSCHMKALFNYDPNIDSLLPCKELGLPFIQGDILEILNQGLYQNASNLSKCLIELLFFIKNRG